MITQLRYVAFAAFGALLCATSAAAQGGKSNRKSDKSVDVAVNTTVVLTTDSELRIIREYYRASGHKPKPLPPGIAKNLARGKKVPPGIMRTRLPNDLLEKLPARGGYEWAIANDVVLLIDVSGIVRDIVRGIF